MSFFSACEGNVNHIVSFHIVIPFTLLISCIYCPVFCKTQLMYQTSAPHNIVINTLILSWTHLNNFFIDLSNTSSLPWTGAYCGSVSPYQDLLYPVFSAWDPLHTPQQSYDSVEHTNGLRLWVQHLQLGSMYTIFVWKNRELDKNAL